MRYIIHMRYGKTSEDIRAMHKSVRPLNSFRMVFWILLSVSRSTDALHRKSEIDTTKRLQSETYVASSITTILQSFTSALARLRSDRSPTLRLAPSLSTTESSVKRATGVVDPETTVEVTILTSNASFSSESRCPSF